MSIAAVSELSKELRRLAIAGASLAPGDHRIAKIIPALEKSGAKVPVFAKIAESAQSLVDSDRKSAAPALLKTNALVMAVLKTQGKSSVEGDITVLSKANLTGNEPISARVLEDVKQALMHSGQGRLETINNAYERGYFGDIRLAEAAISALGDNSHEVANMAAEKLVPPYGSGIAQILADKIDPTAKKPGARLLLALHGCHADAAAEVSRLILEGGEDLQNRFRLEENQEPSLEVRAAALQCLSDSDEDQGILLDNIKAKNKPLRVAALSRLIEQKHPEAESIVLEKLKGSATKQREAIESLPSIHAPAILEAVQNIAENYFKNIKNTTLVEANTLLQILTAIVKSPVDDTTMHFAIRSMDNLKKIHNRFKEETWSAKYNVDRFESLLYTFLASSNRKEAFKVIVDNFSSTSHCEQAIAAMLTLSDPQTVWKEIGDDLKKPRLSERINWLFHGYYHHYFADFQLPPADKWSKPWLNYALERGFDQMVIHLFELDPPAVAKAYLARKKGFSTITEPVLCLASNPKKAEDILKKTKLPSYWRNVSDMLKTLADALKNKKAKEAKLAASEIRPYIYDDKLGDLFEEAIRNHFKKKN